MTPGIIMSQCVINGAAHFFAKLNSQLLATEVANNYVWYFYVNIEGK